MLLIKEYDEDPALQQSNSNELGNEHNILAMNTSIPRREYKVDLSADQSAVTARPIASTTTKQSSLQAFLRTP